MTPSPLTAFAAALADPTLPLPQGLADTPARRSQGFAVYRNNVASTLADALVERFPVCQEVVGESFFRATTRVFVQQHWPKSPRLDDWSANFPGFLAAFPPLTSLPYVADLARLEWEAWRSLHAADAAPLAEHAIAARLADTARLPGMGMALLPSVGTMTSAHAVVSIWQAHQYPPGARRFDFDPATPQDALILRPALTVQVVALPPGGPAFVTALQAGASLAAAADRAFGQAPCFNLQATLGTLIGHRAIAALSDTETPS
ncbi:MAG: putative DNA-binding domain-containing protein [Rhodocyclaceae bacterium]